MDDYYFLPFFGIAGGVHLNAPINSLIKITDDRDVYELERRKAKKTFQPPRNELYSVNPHFNGIYSDQ